MRFRTGLLVGLAFGYYYGAKAGRERYQQIDRYLAQVRETDAYRDLRLRVGDLMDDGIARSRGFVDEAVFRGASPESTGAAPYDFTGDPTLN
jgi:hypothetical protein